jgi:Cdc6-like AAA superfamily ATPase
VLRQLSARAPVVTALLNCWATATFFEVVDDLVTQLRILRAEEHRTCVKLDKLRRHLAGRPFVVVLDELDRMNASERSGAVYNLASLPNTGLICISDSQDALFELDERARSRLDPRTVHFPAYSVGDLKAMLQFRAEMSLVPGSWALRALARIARAAAGDARVAVGALRAAAELAEVRGLGRLKLNNVEQRCQAAAAAKRVQVLNSLTEDHRILHDIVRERKHVVSGNLWEEYLCRCRQLKRKPLAPRTFSNYANRLVEVGLLASERARVKGKVRLFRIVEGAHG